MNQDRKKIAVLLVGLVCFQILAVGAFDVGAFRSPNSISSPEISETNSSIKTSYPSHSTPYRFSVNPKTPLFTEITDEEQKGKLNDKSASNDGTTPATDSEPDMNQIPRSQYWWDSDYAMAVNLEKYAFTSEEDINIEIQMTYNFTPVVNHVIDVYVYKNYWRNWYDYYSYYYDDSGESDKIYYQTVYTDSTGRAVLSITDDFAEGMYTLYVTDYNINSYKEFTVGNEGIFVKAPRYYKPGQDFRAGIHLVDLSDFSPLPEQNFSYSLSYYNWEYDNSGWVQVLAGNGSVDENGYNLLEFIIPSETENEYYMRLNIEIPGSTVHFSMFLYQSWEYYYYSLWGGEQSLNGDHFQYIVTTDKTIYSLGETMHLRAMVLEYSFMNETRTPLAGTPIRVSVNNPDEFTVYWTEILTDSSGILTFDFHFSDDTDIGTYSILFDYQNHSYSYPIKVQYYEKPVFRVSIDTYGKNFFPESTDLLFSKPTLFEGDVIVEYYFGQPVIGAEVELRIVNYNGEIVYSETGKTNALGKYHFAIYLNNIADLSYSFDAHAIVSDDYGRSSESKQSYTRIKDTYIWGYVNPWAPNPGDELTYYFYAYQYLMRSGGSSYWDWEFNPLANVSVSIKLYGINAIWIDEYSLKTRKYISTYKGNTNEFGSGSIKFSVDSSLIGKYDFFQIEVSMVLEDGRSSSSYDYFRFKKYSLSLNLDKKSYLPGDTIKISAKFWDTIANQPVQGKGELYLYDSNYQRIGKATMIFNGEENLSFNLSQYAKSGTYRIYSYVISESNSYYRGFTYQSAYIRFTVGQTYEISLGTNVTTKDEKGYRFLVHSQDSVKIFGSSDVPTNNLHYIEVYKRGLIFSAPLNITNGTFSYEFVVDSSWLPDFTIFVYTISETGHIIENYLVFHVNITVGISLKTDKDVYEPGDFITLTISPTSDDPTLISLSFIDSAVLDVEPEDDSELAYFSNYNYAAYLQSSSSWGVGYDGSNYWWIGYGSPTGGLYWHTRTYDVANIAYDDATDNNEINLLSDVQKGDDGNPTFSFEGILGSFDVDIRKNISESSNWNPKLWITEPTNFTFKLPDNIGEWTIRAVAMGIDQEGGSNVLWGDIQTIKIKSFLPFFVEFDIAQPVTQDDIITIKAYIYNYLGTDTTALVAINAQGLNILNNEVQQVFIPSNMVSEVEFSAYCRDAFNQNITILAATNSSIGDYSDAKQIQIYVKPNGLELKFQQIGVLNASDPFILNYSINENTIYHKETIAIYSDLLDVSLDSWSSLIGYPYGCVEQTVSKLLPSVLIYQYLQMTGELTETVENQIQSIVADGLNRLYTMQHSDGGWGWWQDDESRIYMTSIVLYTMIEIDKAGFYINSFNFNEALAYLLNQQNSDGSWTLASYYGNTAFEATAYISKLLLSQKISAIDLSEVVSKAISFLNDQWDNENYRGSYGAAMYYLATHDTVFENSIRSNTLINFLLENKQSQNGNVFWSFDSDNYWYWGYFGGTVEITANVIMALAADGYITHFPLLQKATQFLLSQKHQYGWWTTADTSSAIQALIFMKNITVGQEILDFNGTINVNVNNQETPIYELNYTADWIPSQIKLRVDSQMETGNNTLTLDSSGTGQFVYMFESSQIVRVMPTIEIQNDITALSGQSFNLSVIFRDIPSWYSLQQVTIELVDLNQNFDIVSPVNTNSLFSEAIPTGTSHFNFNLMAPGNIGNYDLTKVRISGDLVYLNPIDNSTTYQHIYKQIGPIICNVVSPSVAESNDLSSLSEFQYHPISLYPNTNNEDISSKQVSKDGIILEKSFDTHQRLFGGDVITVTIKIQNTRENRQYYALDDFLPEGTEYILESLQILSLDGSNYPVDIKGSRIHVYFASLPVGNTSISYKIQVINLKNSFGGKCELWGMYDKFSLQTHGKELENIPLEYSPNDQIYRDTDNPNIVEANLEDITTSTPKVLINLKVSDANLIYKIRVYFLQENQWHQILFYNKETTEKIDLTIDILDNVDSNVVFMLEIFDIYGNIAQKWFDPVRIFSTLPPYTTIGIIIGVSLGIAGLAALSTKKPEWFQKLLPKKFRTEDKPHSLERNTSFSFIDETEV
ncbi:MG2 domain-containing protein [Candidatus Harpocratesius sp.]